MSAYRNSVSVDEFVSPIDHFVNAETSLQEIYNLMEENSWRHIPITDGNKPIGILSSRDIYLLKNLPEAMSLLAKDVMVKDPYTVEAGLAIEEVALEMSKRKIGSALVVNNSGELEGIFTSTDALNALIEIVRGEAKN
ncbi:MAG: CBS domain-containing protein [Bdellovibrionota bacterium]|nr:CBS domain-containing protein [Bdellovibrionota bacterium]